MADSNSSRVSFTLDSSLDSVNKIELTAEQVAHLNELTRDLPETDKFMRSGPTGTVELTVPMNSNDTVLVKLERGRANK